MKKRVLSLVAISVIASNASALDISLKKGEWNPVGISSAGIYDISSVLDTSKIDSIISYNGNVIESYDPAKPKYSDFTSFEAGKAYWVKANSDTTIKIGDTNIALSDIKYDIGWNFVALPEKEMSEVVNYLTTVGYIVDSIITYDGNIIESYDPDKPKYSDFTSATPGKGYWVKLSKKVGTATTLDGYTIDLISSTTTTEPTSIITDIENSTLADVLTISEDALPEDFAIRSVLVLAALSSASSSS